MLISEVMAVMVKGVLFAEAHGAPQRVRIVENDVDAGELVENHETDGSQDHWLQAPVRADEIAERGLAVGAEGRADRRELAVHVDFGVVDLRQHPGRLVHASLRHQITGRLGDGEREHSVDQSGHAHAQEHPLPGHHGAHHRAGAAADVHEQRVDQQGDEDAEHDAELLQRAEHATLPGRGYFGDIHRRDHGGDARRESAEHAERHEDFDVRRERAADSAYQEANGGDLHHRHAADLVGDAPGQQRADAPGDQRRTDGEAKHGVAGVKMFLDDRGGAIDDGGVVTVEQSAKRGAGSKTGNDIAL